MRHGSLFSGIGGFDLAAEWMGWENVFQVEIDDYCQRVLKKNFPNVERHRDIKEFDGTRYKGIVDIVSGGFPCQPFSTAGKRMGTADDRHLWPEMLRVISEIQPQWVMGENVFGLLNWSRGMVFEQVQADLEAQGYFSQAYVLPACAKDAPHRRDRVWIIAYSQSNFRGYEFRNEGSKSQEIQEKRFNESFIVTNHNKIGLSNEKQIRELGWFGHRVHYVRNLWEKFPTQPPVCRGDDGLPNRVDRIKGLGNAIVPQVAYEIFKAIEVVQLKINITH